MTTSGTATLRVILGDQLSRGISSLRDCDKAHDIVLMCEVAQEATYVRHHKKKIAFLFSAMRHFATALIADGYNVTYTKLDDPKNAGSFTGEVTRAVESYRPRSIAVTFPGEYRVLEEIRGWQTDLAIPVDIRPDDRFLASPEEFATWADGRKELRMEFFYREMRRKYKILIDGDTPVGGKWNYDTENRKPPDDGGMFTSTPLFFEPDDITRDVMQLVSTRFAAHFGDIDPFYFAVTREQALEALRHFIDERLPLFGDHQDAMQQGNPWMYHSYLSAYINCGLLDPLEVAVAAQDAYHRGAVPLNAAEGFIRQIIGWREYVRGVYWLKMPEYAEMNALHATRPLPWLYWGGDTKMNCLKQCVTETRQNAYAHHIQRLMVLGNFALLAGVRPKDLNEWFLVVYADAYEWVEMPNVSGMVLYADGGYLASKPYAASGAYINKMSDYCRNCAYNVTQKEGPDACPFNYLYWDFLIRNKEKLKSNHRLSMPYNTLSKMQDARIAQIRKDSENFLNALQTGQD
jgi:deoxyribodipyrimidine photolyase-related protein